jgi:hypothetical protein
VLIWAGNLAVILRRKAGADGDAAFDVSVADDWYTFSKATTLSAEDRDMDVEEVERRFELQRRSSNVRTPVIVCRPTCVCFACASAAVRLAPS